jgi:hypothetical protein
MGALLKAWAETEGPRRAAKGAARVVRPAGAEVGQPLGCARLPRSRSQEARGRSLGLLAGCLAVVGSTTSQGAGKTGLWTFGLSPHGEVLWEETFGAP